jgi:cobalt-zinc-cadmium efflux system outer membrane protein
MLERPSAILLILLPTLICGCAAPMERDILAELRRDGWLDGDAAPDDAAPPGDAAAASGPGPIDVPSEGPITMAWLLDAAERLNPRLAAARAAVGEAAGLRWQASLPPNPSLEIESEDAAPGAGGFGRSTSTVGLAIPLRAGAGREAETESWSAEQRARRRDLQELRRQIAGNMRRVRAEIDGLNQSLGVHEEVLLAARDTLEMARLRFEARAAPESEASRAGVEVQALELAAARLRRERQALALRLSGLLGGLEIPIERLEPEPGGPTAELASLEPFIERHPALLAARERVEAARQRLRAAEQAGRHPELTVNLRYGRNHDTDEHVVEGGVSIPLTVFDRRQGQHLAARHELAAADALHRALRVELWSEVQAAHRSCLAAEEQIEGFQRIVDAAGLSLTQAREGYRAGRLAFLELLDAQRTLTQARLAQLDLRRQRLLALAELRAATGEGLEQEAMDPGAEAARGSSPMRTQP